MPFTDVPGKAAGTPVKNCQSPWKEPLKDPLSLVDDGVVVIVWFDPTATLLNAASDPETMTFFQVAM